MSDVNNSGGTDDHLRHAGHDGGAGHVHRGGHGDGPPTMVITLNTALVVAEAVYGYLGNSTALMADAGDNLSDVFGMPVRGGRVGCAYPLDSQAVAGTGHELDHLRSHPV